MKTLDKKKKTPAAPIEKETTKVEQKNHELFASIYFTLRRRLNDVDASREMKKAGAYITALNAAILPDVIVKPECFDLSELMVNLREHLGLSVEQLGARLCIDQEDIRILEQGGYRFASWLLVSHIRDAMVIDWKNNLRADITEDDDTVSETAATLAATEDTLLLALTSANDVAMVVTKAMAARDADA